MTRDDLKALAEAYCGATVEAFYVSSVDIRALSMDYLRLLAQETRAQQGQHWICIVGHGSWSKCYGTFDSYEKARFWIRVNQFEEAQTYPVNAFGVEA
jgi:hypothetical protein